MVYSTADKSCGNSTRQDFAVSVRLSEDSGGSGVASIDFAKCVHKSKEREALVAESQLYYLSLAVR